MVIQVHGCFCTILEFIHKDLTTIYGKWQSNIKNTVYIPSADIKINFCHND